MITVYTYFNLFAPSADLTTAIEQLYSQALTNRQERFLRNYGILLLFIYRFTYSYHMNFDKALIVQLPLR